MNRKPCFCDSSSNLLNASEDLTVDWSTKSNSRHTQRTILRGTKSIKNFLKSLDSPTWYRGISKSQKDAADSLLKALSNDFQQKTTFRVEKLLKEIGLIPLPDKSLLIKLINLCGQSDLAFLWFLMEILYNKNPNNYSVNEQIILSCIAHLDMNFTLRGLDRLLPISSAMSNSTKKPFNSAVKMERMSKAALENAHSSMKRKTRLVKDYQKEKKLALGDYVERHFISAEHSFKNKYAIQEFLGQNLKSEPEVNGENDALNNPIEPYQEYRRDTNFMMSMASQFNMKQRKSSYLDSLNIKPQFTAIPINQSNLFPSDGYGQEARSIPSWFNSKLVKSNQGFQLDSTYQGEDFSAGSNKSRSSIRRITRLSGGANKPAIKGSVNTNKNVRQKANLTKQKSESNQQPPINNESSPNNDPVNNNIEMNSNRNSLSINRDSLASANSDKDTNLRAIFSTTSSIELLLYKNFSKHTFNEDDIGSRASFLNYYSSFDDISVSEWSLEEDEYTIRSEITNRDKRSIRFAMDDDTIDTVKFYVGNMGRDMTNQKFRKSTDSDRSKDNIADKSADKITAETDDQTTDKSMDKSTDKSTPDFGDNISDSIMDSKTAKSISIKQASVQYYNETTNTNRQHLDKSLTINQDLNKKKSSLNKGSVGRNRHSPSVSFKQSPRSTIKSFEGRSRFSQPISDQKKIWRRSSSISSKRSSSKDFINLNKLAVKNSISSSVRESLEQHKDVTSEVETVLPQLKPKKRDSIETVCRESPPCHYTSTKRLPYFRKVPLMKPRPTCLIGYPLKRELEMGYLNSKQLRDPAVILANEKARWFKDFTFNTNECMVRGLLADEIERIIDGIESASIKPDQLKALCRHHMEIDLVEKSFENKLKQLEEERIKEMGILYQRKQESLKRVLNRLHEDVESCRAEFRRLAADCRRYCISKTLTMGLNYNSPTSSMNRILEDVAAKASDCCVCLLSDDDYGIVENIWGAEGCQKLKEHCDNEANTTGEAMPTTPRTTASPNIYNYEDKENYQFDKCNRNDISSLMDRSPPQNCQCGKVNKPIKVNNSSCFRSNWEGKPNSGRIRSSLMDFRQKYLYPEENAINSEEIYEGKPVPCYFEMGEDGKPYKFDYRKIFTFGQNTSDQMRVKRAFIEAIDSDICLLNRLEYEDVTEDAVDRCVHKTWKDGIHYQEEKSESEDDNRTEEERKLHQARLNLFPQLDYYDPNDNDLMDTMLKNALHYLKDDPRYVLASLPHVHRLPILMEWIRQRYGKRYTPEELAKSYAKSLPILRALRDVVVSVNVPSGISLNTEDYVSYTNHDSLIRKFNQLRYQHYRKMNRALLAQTRILYLASNPYKCGSFANSDTFFAYLPRHQRDLCYFRPWQKWERRSK